MRELLTLSKTLPSTLLGSTRGLRTLRMKKKEKRKKREKRIHPNICCCACRAKKSTLRSLSTSK